MSQSGSGALLGTKLQKTPLEKLPDEPDLEPFVCYVCGLHENCMVQSPSSSQKSVVRFVEEVFVIKDPFVPPTERNPLSFILIGSLCSLCKRQVCADPNCSIFYVKRFCNACAFLHKDKFSQEVQLDIEKMYSYASSAKARQ